MRIGGCEEEGDAGIDDGGGIAAEGSDGRTAEDEVGRMVILGEGEGEYDRGRCGSVTAKRDVEYVL